MAARVRLLPPSLNVSLALAPQQTGSNPGFLTAEKCSGWEDMTGGLRKETELKGFGPQSRRWPTEVREQEGSRQRSRVLWHMGRAKAWVPRMKEKTK